MRTDAAYSDPVRRARGWALVFALAWITAAPGALASPASAAAPRNAASAGDVGGPTWASLTPQQKQALAPLERDWSTIDAPRKIKWLEVVARFPAMPPEERSRIQQRMAEWAHMTPAERGRARLVFQEAKQLSPEERQARWQAYQALPDDQRRALAARSKPADERPHRAASQPATPLGAALPKAAASAPQPRASGPQVKAVAPTIVQAKPGATTRLMTTPAPPPQHQQPGRPTIAARPGEVDRHTLLPRSGPQAAASAVRQP